MIVIQELKLKWNENMCLISFGFGLSDECDRHKKKTEKKKKRKKNTLIEIEPHDKQCGQVYWAMLLTICWNMIHGRQLWFQFETLTIEQKTQKLLTFKNGFILDFFFSLALPIFFVTLRG